MRIAWSLIWGRFLMSVNPRNKGSLRKASRVNRAILSLSISYSPPIVFEKDARMTSRIGDRRKRRERRTTLNVYGLDKFSPSLIMPRRRGFRNYTPV
jgi:hypothetical protein